MATNPVEAARRVLANKQYEEIDGILLDTFTASAIVAVADKLGAEMYAKLVNLPLDKAARVCLKLVNK